jgi:hypothetical protein
MMQIYSHPIHPPTPARGISRQQLLACGALILTLGWSADFMQNRSALITPANAADACEQVVQPQATLSRSDLAKLLTIPEGKPRQAIRELIHQPYCQLPKLQIRAGAVAERDAYPLAFDPRHWLVVLYEGDQYAGFEFVLHAKS